MDSLSYSSLGGFASWRVTILALLFLVVSLHTVSGWVLLGSINGSLLEEDQGIPYPLNASAVAKVTNGPDNRRRMFISSPYHDSGKGALFVYDFDIEQLDWKHVGTMVGGHEGEYLGSSLSVSREGSWFALSGMAQHGNRHHRVQVFGIQEAPTEGNTTSLSFFQIGSDITCGNGANGLLGKDSIQVAETNVYWIVLGCDSVDHRGVVEVYYSYSSNAPQSYGDWYLYASPLKGTHADSGFGSSIAFSGTPENKEGNSSLFWLAVSSPGFDYDRGMVNVFVAGVDDWMVHGGPELVGSEQGERFGHSIGLGITDANDRYLVVGSPFRNIVGYENGNDALECEQCGAIQIYKWANGDVSWILLSGMPLFGFFSTDQYGSLVDMTPNADRVAVLSPANDLSLGYIEMLDRDGDTFVSSQGGIIFGFEGTDGWGRTIGISYQGSIIVVTGAIASSSGGGLVHAFLDDSPFCAEPWQGSDALHSLGVLKEKSLCRSSDHLIHDETLCKAERIDRNGTELNCIWVPGLHFPGSAPVEFTFETSQVSSIPPSMPSTNPSSSPSKGDVHSKSFHPSPEGFDSLDIPGDINGSITDGILPSNILVSSCRCGDRGECLNEPLRMGTRLKICVDVDHPDISFMKLRNLSIFQDGFSVNLVENDDARVDDIFSLCLRNHCLALMVVHPFFFMKEHTPSIKVSGFITAGESGRRNLRAGAGAHELQLEFKTVVPLVISEERSPAALVKNGDHAGKNSDKSIVTTATLCVILVGLVVLLLLLAAKSRRVKWSSSIP